MPINSETIQKKEFHIVFKGYKPEEVDKFLDLLSIEVERLTRKNKELQEYVDRLKYERNSESDEMKKVLQDALVSAHKVAEDIKRKAELEAKEMYSAKKTESEREFKELELKKKKLEEDIGNIKKQYLGLKQYLEDALKNMEQFETTEDLRTEPEGTAEPAEEQEEKAEEEVNEEESSLDMDEATKDEQESLEDEKEQEEVKEEEQEDEEEDEDDFNIDRKRKSIDIANPDIIDDFFKTDE